MDLNEFIELRLFITKNNFSLIKTYVKNWWVITKKSEQITDTYFIGQNNNGDIIKMRNSLIKHKKLIKRWDNINIFLAEDMVPDKVDISLYESVTIYKKRKTYKLSDNSKLEIGRIEVFNKKYYTVCIEAFKIYDFIYLFNKVGMKRFFHSALKNQQNQILNGYNEFINHLLLNKAS